MLKCERVKLPRVHRVAKGGRVYRFHRITRAALPNDVPEDHPTFTAAWATEEAKAQAGQRPAARRRGAAGSIAATWAAFKATEGFKGFSAVYRQQMTSHAERACADYGGAPIADLRARHIRADIEKLKPHPANHRLKWWRLICTYAFDRNLSKVVATDGVKKPKAPPAAHYPPWDADEVAAYRNRWPIGTSGRLAFELLYWTAARTNDAVRLAPPMVGADGLLTFRQSKTGGPAHVPWTSPLPEWAAGWEEDRAILHQCLRGCRGFTYLETQGKVRSVKGLGNIIVDGAGAAGFKKTAHGLRATRLTLIAEAGGSAHAIMAWGGHVSLSEAEKYTTKVDRKRVLQGAARAAGL